MNSLGSRSTDRRIGRRLATLLLAAPLLPAILCAQETRSGDVQVLFKLVEARHRLRFRQDELEAIEAKTTTALAAELSRRFPHLRFGPEPRAGGSTLTVVVNAGIPYSEAPQPEDQPNLVSWHFRLEGKLLEVPVTGRWDFRTLEEFWVRIPAAEEFQKQVDAYLGRAPEGAPLTPAARGEAERRYLLLFNDVLNRIPLFVDQNLEHVRKTPFVVIRAPRSDYRSSVPDGSEMHVTVEMAETGLDPQKRHFRARVLDAQAVRREAEGLGALSNGIVTEAAAPITELGTRQDHVARLATFETPQPVQKRVFLIRVGFLSRSVEVPPEAFEPGS
jgi:hypothetical protein